MTATPFNPLATARSLEAAGIEHRQAEAIADRGDFATRADLAKLETRLMSTHATKAELATLRSE